SQLRIARFASWRTCAGRRAGSAATTKRASAAVGPGLMAKTRICGPARSGPFYTPCALAGPRAVSRRTTAPAPHHQRRATTPAPALPAPTALARAIDVSLLARRLREACHGDVLFDIASRGRYATDASIYQIFPVGVVVPKNAADLAVALDIARDEGVALLPRG